MYNELCGAEEACWAHNPKVRGSKPRGATRNFLCFAKGYIVFWSVTIHYCSNLIYDVWYNELQTTMSVLLSVELATRSKGIEPNRPDGLKRILEDSILSHVQ